MHDHFFSTMIVLILFNWLFNLLLSLVRLSFFEYIILIIPTQQHNPIYLLYIKVRRYVFLVYIRSFKFVNVRLRIVLIPYANSNKTEAHHIQAKESLDKKKLTRITVEKKSGMKCVSSQWWKIFSLFLFRCRRIFMRWNYECTKCDWCYVKTTARLRITKKLRNSKFFRLLV